MCLLYKYYFFFGGGAIYYTQLFKKIVLKRLNNALAIARPNFPNPQQQGFRKYLSCITTAFNLQETIFHQIEQNSNVDVGMLNQRAAFDVVWLSGLFLKKW